jgi:hypothetical protein
MRSSSPRSIAGVKIIQRWDRWTKFRSIHTSRDVPGRSPSVGPGQKRGVFGAIKRELRRRSAIEPVIGHMKAEGHLGRCYLKGGAGDAANAILSAVGYNFRRILAWDLLCQILFAILRLLISQSALNPAS